MVVRLQVRHDTKQSWEYNNPILANGEIGVEIDNELIANRMKVGNGNDKWNDLKFIDEHLVHSVPTGAEAENIDGEKVFNDDVTIKSNIHLPSDKTIEGMFSHAESDSEGNVISEFYQRTLSYVDNYVDESTDWNTCVNNGVYEVYASSFNEDLNTPLQYKDNIGTQGFLLVYADKDGNVMQVYKPALTTSSAATVIPVYRIKDDSVDTWTAWTSFNDADTNIVHTFNNEEISGVKTFINKVVINNGVLELGNGVGASEIKKKNGETILTEDSNGLTLSTTRNTIRFRPNGSNESNGEVVINNDGVINGKALKDSEGNVITNVYAKKADVIKTAKAHTLAESELLSSSEYPEYYQKVLDKKKKSFDISKFTIVGNPAITEDGILSYSDKTNYLTFNNSNSSEDWEISFVLKPNYTRAASYNATFSRSTTGLQFYNQKNDHKWHLEYNGSTQIISIELNENYYKITLQNKNGNFTMITTNLDTGASNTKTSTYTENPITLDGLLRIGLTQSSNYGFDGKLDLKQFSIMVDGEEVFNGHEERIDTIKADNYTVVGSPVISEDGIASGFSEGNYLTQNLSISNATDFELISPVFYNILSSSRETVIMMPNTGALTHLSLWSYANDTNATMVINQDNNGTRIELVRKAFTMTPDVGYQVKWVLKNGLWDIYYRTTENAEWIRLTTTSVAAIDTVTINNLYIGKDSITHNAWCKGTIDLNSFKIYVDGNLVYQPCLKIPYTYSEDGTKVVDIGYIDRVEDCYNQFGTGNYFILDEYNNMFQMPLDTVDGYTRTLYNYRKGKTSYSYNTDLECNYSDTCVSGTRYNFLKPFADSNYTLTVPTSSKDATGFTPTSTVDFMAKGRITLD